ncbi:hypothetical protein TrST_g7039 [Triparma strigata]|uniref:Uncharacterized protein n=1 Tax=Triparma strigata TaxID=1606541 RepID=A0A9W7APP4_9STRA|nr:hypothetical protein TrST_g7039 [Triparma strigata]
MDSGRESGRDSVRVIIADGARRLSLVATEQASLAAEQASLAGQLWLTNLRDFMLESSGYAVVASILPLACIFCLKQSGYDQVVSEFYTEHARFDPPILKESNVTIVPYTPQWRSDFFADNTTMSVATYLVLIAFCCFSVTAILFRARVMLRPTMQGTVLGAAITGLVGILMSISLIRVYEHADLWTRDTHKKKSTKSGLLKWYIGVVVAFFIELIFGFLFTYVVMPGFFRSSTTMFQKLLFRTLTPILFLNIGIEVGWKFTVYIMERTKCDIQDEVVGFLSFYCVVVSVTNRLMQGSANTVSQSLIFEVAGTISELITADSLLQGVTPWEDTFGRLLKLCKRSGDNVVQPREGEGEEETGQIKTQRSTKEERRKWKLQFCETTMHLLLLSEALALLVSSYFWLLMRANPGDPGSPAIPISQTLTNMCIMLFGELVVTDSIIGYASHTFQRYPVDLPLSWRDFKTSRRHRLRYFTVIMSIYTSSVVLNLPLNMCYTSRGDDERNWALTSCPAFPKNITEMSRVGELYEEGYGGGD